jgi:hypothetical protein
MVFIIQPDQNEPAWGKIASVDVNEKNPLVRMDKGI